MVRGANRGTPFAHLLMSVRNRHPFVLFDGLPLAGTTRTMSECVRTVLPDARLIMLSPPDLIAAAFGQQFDELSPYEQYVVWFDDLSPGELVLLERDVLDIVSVKATVMAGISTRWLRLLAADTTEVTAHTRALLADYTNHHHVPFVASEHERRLAQAAAPGIKVGPSIGVSFAGGDALLRRYDYVLRAFPAARSLAETVVDIRRVGVHRGLSKREIFNVYAQASGLKQAASREFEQAFEWVTTPPKGTAEGVLRRNRDGLWTAQSYLAGADDGDHGHPVRPLDADRWRLLLTELRPDDAFYLAVAALLHGHRDIAHEGLRRAGQSGDAVLHFRALRAAGDLGQ